MSILDFINQQISRICFPLNVMAWQITRLRITRYWATLSELFQGCLVFLALFLARQSILLTEKSDGDANTRGDMYNTYKIYYSPHTNFTDMLMNNVISELNNNTAQEMESKVSWELSNKLYVLFNDKKPSKLLDNNIVIVNILDPGTNTNNFTYFIKMFNNFEPRTEDEKTINVFLRHLTAPDEVANPLLGTVQWAIDKSYIKQHVKRDVTALHLEDRVQFVSKDLERLHNFIIVCTVIALLPYFMYKVTGIIVSKRTGFWDLVRLSGVSPTVYRAAHFFDAAAMGILYAVIITFFLKVTSKPILPYTNSLIIVIAIMIYFLNISMLAILSSTLSSNNQHATSIAFLIYICTFILDSTWHSLGTTTSALKMFLCCILPHAPIYMFWAEVTYAEYLGQGATFSNITRTRSSLSVLQTWLFSCIQFVFMLILDWYLDLVLPRRFGIPRKWDFIFKREFIMGRKKKRVNFHVTAEYRSQVLRDTRYFESGPVNAEIAVKVSNVCKTFKDPSGYHCALDAISFDVYRGEVTVILGQTGAGKSTLMSIIGGMFAPSEGTVYVNGLDNVQRVQDLLDVVALCPQESVIHRRLSVRENIMLFVNLTRKGTSETADKLIKHLNLSDKMDFYPKELSKEALRCVQVACALVSDSDVLVLDEPTSGMAYEARHRIWDLVMDLRGEKTIIMSTSYLEEAEVLGDRIAILSKAKLRCYGSPGFLKEAIGGGFNLTITLNNEALMGELLELVGKIIPNMTYKLQGKRTVSFVLLMTKHELYTELFAALEEGGGYLTINSIDLGLMMEDIYLQFIDEADAENVNVTEMLHKVLESDRLKGWPLMLNQFKVLIRRNYRYLWMKKYQFIIVQVLIPIIGLMIITLTTNRYLGFSKLIQHQQDSNLKLLHNLRSYRRSDVRAITGLNRLDTVFTEDVEKAFKKPDHTTSITKKAVGLMMHQNKSKLIVTSDPTEVTKSVNIFSNMYLNLHVPNNIKRIITTYKAIPRWKSVLIKPKNWFLCLKWCVCVAFLSIINLTPSIILSISERKAGSRITHIMAGCSPIIHWSSKLVAHFLVYMAIIPTSVIFCCLLLDFDKTFNSILFVGAVLLLLVLFALAFLAHLYFISFIASESTVITQVFIMSLGFGMVIPTTLRLIEFLWVQHPWLIVPYRLVTIIAYFSPMYPFFMGMTHLVTQSRMNAFCNLNRHQCPDLVVGLEMFSTATCCESSSSTPFGYFDATESSHSLFLVFQFIIYLIIVILLERKVIQTILEHVTHINYRKPAQVHDNPEVKKERDLVQNLIDTKQYKAEVFIAYDIHKNFRYFNTWRSKGKHNAVKGISLRAKPGECIGIVGPPRAGKSAVLRMLAGDIVMTRGNSWVDGYSIKNQRCQYMRKVARSGLDIFLTGLENLLIICQLQGLDYNKAISSSDLALQYLGLNPYRDIKVRKYNLACTRRLQLAVVYIMSPTVAFIDEPMLNADPMTKPLISQALKLLVAAPTTIIMTVASVTRQDMESLYDRIAILIGGQFRAIGPATEVIGSLTGGFIVRIKLIVITSYKILHEDETQSLIDMRKAHLTQSIDAFSKGIKELITDFKQMFETSVLIEELVCLLVFYIEDNDHTMLYGEMFSKLQQLKKKYKILIDHYTLSAATIQDVFFKMRKEKKDEKKLTIDD